MIKANKWIDNFIIDTMYLTIEPEIFSWNFCFVSDFRFLFFALFQKVATEITIHYKSKKKIKQQIT